MKYIMIFHANLHYSNLPPEKQEFVIRHSYEKIHDLFAGKYPQAKYVFEASGYTLERIAELTPDVLEKLKDAFNKGTCEFMGSPYGHSMLANFPYEDGLHSLLFSMETYEKLLGFQPESAWNPECSWNERIPEMFLNAGFKNLILDWESFLISNNEEVRKVEYNPDRTRKDGKGMPYYDIDPDTDTLHFPLQIIPGLKGLMRTDRACNELLWYMMGKSEETEGEVPLDKPLKAIDKWSGKKKDGFLIPYAEDAEYCGTTGYFFLKYYNQFRLFEDSPQSLERLDKLVAGLRERGELITVKEAVDRFPTREDVAIKYDDKITWHRTFADAWAHTPWSREMDPVCMELHHKLMEAEKKADTPEKKAALKQAWRHLICAENSDGRWPPPPLSPADFNIQYCKEHLDKAKQEIARELP